MTAARAALLLFKDGPVLLYRVTDIDTGDTADLAADLAKINAATAIQTTSMQLPSAAVEVTIAGTVVTFTTPGLADDTVHLLVTGSAA